MGDRQAEDLRAIQERLAEEALVKEHVDDEGNRWTKPNSAVRKNIKENLG